MSTGSPTAFLSWAILASLFLAFFVYHLWSYDKFQCLLWNAGRQPGAFKRVMTYSYFLSVPLLVVFGVGITILKFQEGFISMRDAEIIIPKPVDLWQKGHRHVLLGLYFVFSVAWASEQVTHFEELTFWLFLLDQGPEKREWFSSWEYRLWYCSCVCTILGMPLTTLVARHNMDTIDAWIFLVGSLSSTVTNVLFLYVLFRFPAFLRHVKAEGADPEVVVRLSTFYELNLVRMIFRFAASLPLLILAADGIRGNHPIDRSQFWSDFLLMISAIGQFISSSITLMIFFPRSVTKEAGYRHKAASTMTDSGPLHAHPTSPKSPGRPPSTHSPAFYIPSHPPTPARPMSAGSSEMEYSPSEEPVPGYHHIPVELERARKQDDAYSPAQALVREHRMTRREMATHGSTSRPVSISVAPRSHMRLASASTLHPYVTSYTSPIDLIEMPPDGTSPPSA
ncbi:hypothetical protein BV25DRAFT_1826161 [Artomyces pyxidatus]|uniref:Uncharacterized protein n=1 Tax=Artomyces pyxidatus TaxID=48021 RepID=A0ACB8T0H9_9AGAM|nr:hypothetical protein BV25DRAFT_1826161 [Artomyces pyxidatus]